MLYVDAEVVFGIVGTVRLAYYIVRKLGHRDAEEFIRVTNIDELRRPLDQVCLYGTE